MASFNGFNSKNWTWKYDVGSEYVPYCSYCAPPCIVTLVLECAGCKKIIKDFVQCRYSRFETCSTRFRYCNICAQMKIHLQYERYSEECICLKERILECGHLGKEGYVSEMLAMRKCVCISERKQLCEESDTQCHGT